MDTYTTMVKFFQEGGIFMYPIALVAALGAAVAIERWFHLWRTESANRRMWDEVAPFLKTGDFKRAISATSSSGSAIGQILGYGLARVQTAKRRDDVEKAMEESMMEVVPKPHKRPHHLWPELELVRSNVKVMCRRCHFLIGHFSDWSSFNKDVDTDCYNLSNKVANRPYTKDRWV